MSITLSTIKDRLSRRLKDIHDISDALLYDMATDLNQLLYREIFSEDPERFIITQSYNVSFSPSTQPLPVDFRDVQEFGTGFFIVNNSGVASNRKLVITGYGSQEEGYYINGTNVIFTGISSSSTVILRYIPVLADITSLSGTFIVPDEFKELVLEGMVVAYYKNEEDPREAEADQRFARLLTQFLATVKKAPRIYGLTLPINAGA